MEKVKIPTGYQTVMPYLIVKDAVELLAFMHNVFGATEKMKVMADDETIRHAEVQIGGSTIMFANSGEQWLPQTAGLYIHVENADETYRKALAEGATSVMEPSDQDYGRASGVKDSNGNVWWITSVK